jgi:hypothetical protein
MWMQPGDGQTWERPNVKCEICGDASHPSSDCTFKGKDVPLPPAKKEVMNSEYDKFLSEISSFDGKQGLLLDCTIHNFKISMINSCNQLQELQLQVPKREKMLHCLHGNRLLNTGPLLRELCHGNKVLRHGNRELLNRGVNNIHVRLLKFVTYLI